MLGPVKVQHSNVSHTNESKSKASMRSTHAKHAHGGLMVSSLRLAACIDCIGADTLPLPYSHCLILRCKQQTVEGRGKHTQAEQDRSRLKTCRALEANSLALGHVLLGIDSSQLVPGCHCHLVHARWRVMWSLHLGYGARTSMTSVRIIALAGCACGLTCGELSTPCPLSEAGLRSG